MGDWIHKHRWQKRLDIFVFATGRPRSLPLRDVETAWDYPASHDHRVVLIP
jgi:hypothetical protein